MNWISRDYGFESPLVTQGLGIGTGSDAGIDRSVTYSGRRIKINLDK